MILLTLSAAAATGQTPQFADPEVARAFELLRTERIEASFELLRGKLQAQPDHAEALYVLGLGLAAQGHVAEATTAFERSVAASPASPASRELGLSRGSQNRLRDCLRLLRGWFETHPDDLEAGIAAAYCAVGLYRVDDARALLADLPQDLVAVRVLQARLLVLESRGEEAVSTLAPTLAASSGTMELDVRSLLAQAHLLIGQADRAVEVLTGFDRTPTMAGHLAEAQFQLGQLDAARTTLEPWARRAAESDRDELGTDVATLLRDYGRVLSQSGQAAEAVPYLKLASRVAPADQQIWRLLGQAQAASGNEIEAELALERFRHLASAASAQSAANAATRIGLRDPTGATLRRAVELAQLGRLDEALVLLRDEAGLVRDDSRPQLVAARLLISADRPAEALVAAGDAAVIEPNSPLPDFERARALLALDRRKEARQALDSALTKRPDYPDALVEIARLELRAGDPDGARRQLERALAIDPDHQPGLELLSTLDTDQ